MKLEKLSLYFILCIVFSGCTYRANMRPRYLSDNIMLNLNIKHPIAIINSSKKSGDIRLCGGGGYRVIGDPYIFTETAIAVLQKTLRRNNIEIDNTADNKIELLVQPTCIFGFVKKVTVLLKAKTGSGLEKEYTAWHRVGHPGQYTRSFEIAVSDCVEQMINDRDIRNYIET